MWYQVNPKGFSYEHLLELYRILDQREQSFREDLFRFTNFYSAVCLAILGITLSGFLALYSKGSVSLFLLLGPAFSLGMCLLGLRVTGQIFRRINEEISTKAKLENILGLDRSIMVNEFLGEKPAWPEDNTFLPARHAARRFDEPSTQAFFKSGSKTKGGFNTNNKLYFGMIGAFSIVLMLVIVVFGCMGC